MESPWHSEALAQFSAGRDEVQRASKTMERSHHSRSKTSELAKNILWLLEVDGIVSFSNGESCREP